MIILILLFQIALEPSNPTKIIERERITIPLDERSRRHTEQFGFGLAINESTVFVSNSYQDHFRGDRVLAYSFDLETNLQLCVYQPEWAIRPPDRAPMLTANEDLLVAGAYNAWGNAPQSGVVHVFDARTGKQLQRLAPYNSETADMFGLSLALDQDTLVIGAPRAQRGYAGTGTVYVYNPYTGELLHELAPEYATPLPELKGMRERLKFGNSVAVSGDLIVVGAPFESTVEEYSGAVFVFDRNSGQQLYTLYSPTIQKREQFGFNVALNQNRLVVSGLNTHVVDPDTCEILNSLYGGVHLYEATSGRHITSLDKPKIRHWMGLSLDVSEDFIAAGGTSSDDGETGYPVIHLYNLDTGEHLHTLYVSWFLYGSPIVYRVAISTSAVAVSNMNEQLNKRPVSQGAIYLFDTPMPPEVESQPNSQP